jgi:hypothetical protein
LPVEAQSVVLSARWLEVEKPRVWALRPETTRAGAVLAQSVVGVSRHRRIPRFRRFAPLLGSARQSTVALAADCRDDDGRVRRLGPSYNCRSGRFAACRPVCDSRSLNRSPLQPSVQPLAANSNLTPAANPRSFKAALVDLTIEGLWSAPGVAARLTDSHPRTVDVHCFILRNS